MGRPTKLTPERHQKIVELVRAGNYQDTAARAAGIEPATFYNWMKRGKAAKSGIYFEFFNDIKSAEADAEAEAVAGILEAGKQPAHWTAKAWYLERRHNSKWRKVDKRELEVDATVKVKAYTVGEVAPSVWDEDNDDD